MCNCVNCEIVGSCTRSKPMIVMDCHHHPCSMSIGIYRLVSCIELSVQRKKIINSSLGPLVVPLSIGRVHWSLGKFIHGERTSPYQVPCFRPECIISCRQRRSLNIIIAAFLYNYIVYYSLGRTTFTATVFQNTR